MTRRLATVSIVASSLALLAFPAASPAGTASTVSSGDRQRVLYDAAPGEANELLVEVSRNSRAVRLTDGGAAIAVGPGCEAQSDARVVCRLNVRVRLVQVSLGDGDDRAEATTSNPAGAQVNIVGGDGEDLLRGRGPTRFNFGGDGGDDTLSGSEGPDVLRGGAGNDFASGRGGDDLLIGDSGRDVLRGRFGRDRIFGGLGSDRVDSRDLPELRDGVVSCGPGRDRLTADEVDGPIIVGCEGVRVP